MPTSSTNDESQRIDAIDVLRGVALLGILPMNITHFAMPHSYFNPTVFGGDQFGNQVVHAFVHVLVDQKAMALFSMLFGASVVLLWQKLERQGRRAALIHYSRNGWLLVFGGIHFALLSDIDILCIYAFCAFVLYFFRRTAPNRLFICGLIIFLIPVAVFVQLETSLRRSDANSQAALHEMWQPDDAKLDATVKLSRGSYAQQIAWRLGHREKPAPANKYVRLAGASILFATISRALGMMFIGMAFFKWDILTAKQSKRFYGNLALVGLGLGVPLATYGLYQHYAHDWGWQYSMLSGRRFNNVATIFQAFGYMSIVILWSQSSLAVGFQTRLAAVGRMALSNYVGQSVLATSVFYGFGFGWYGYLSRVEQLAVVVGILSLQVAISHWWLGRFKFGPLEWLWRSLTYWKWMPARV